MFFKHLSLFRLPADFAIDAETFELALAEHPLRAPGPLELETRGFISPFNRADAALSHGAEGATLLALGQDTKLLPASVLADAVKGAGTLDQDKLTTYIRGHSFRTILGDISFGDDGDWKEARIIFEQFHDVKGNDVEQFRDGKVEIILEPVSMRSGTLVEPYSDITH